METGLVVQNNNRGAMALVNPEDSRQLMVVAAKLFESGLFPNAQSPAGAFAIVQYGHELGINAVTALQTFNNIKGKLAASAQLIQALGERAGLAYQVPESTDKKCTIVISDGKLSHTETYTIEEAKAAELTGKEIWKKYPKEMLRARCVSRGTRIFRPSVILGLYTQDELSNGEIGVPAERIKNIPPELEPETVDIDTGEVQPPKPVPQPDPEEQAKRHLWDLTKKLMEAVNIKLEETELPTFGVAKHYGNAVGEWAREAHPDLLKACAEVEQDPDRWVNVFVAYRLTKWKQASAA